MPTPLPSTPNLLTSDWQLDGATLAAGRGGRPAVLLQRERDAEQPRATVLVTGLQPGRYTLSAWFLPNMRALPDPSFSAAVDVEWLDAQGHVLGASGGPWANGRTPLPVYREAALTAPPATVSARLTAHFRMTAVGRCAIGDVMLAAGGEAAGGGAPALGVSLRSDRTFHDPGEPIVLQATLSQSGALTGPVAFRAVVTDSAGNRVATVESTATWGANQPRQAELTVPAGRLPTGEWCRAEVTAETEGYRPGTAACGLLVLPRPTDFTLPTNSPFAILDGYAYFQRWVGARWQRPNWSWNLPEMELPKRYGVTYVALVNAADQALHGDMSMAEYAAYVEESVRRHKELVCWWQLGNEPPLYQQGMPERYVAVLKAGYEAAKRADPACHVVMAGITGLDVDPEMVEKVLALGAGNWCDAIDIHLYVPVPQMDALIAKIRGDMRKHGVDKPLICTEVTALLGSDPGERETAGHVYKRYAVGIAGGLAQIYWFVLRWPNANVPFDYCGLVSNQDESPRPGAAAYWRLAQALEGAKIVERETQPGGLWRFTFERGGRRAFVLWTDGPEPVPAALACGAGDAELIDVAGRVVPLQSPSGGLSVTATPEPVLVLAPAGGQRPGAAPAARPASAALARGSTARFLTSLPPPVSTHAPAGLELTMAGGGYELRATPEARIGDSTLTLTYPGGALRLPVTVTEPLAVDIRPLPGTPDRLAVRVANLSAQSCDGSIRLVCPVTRGLRPAVFEAPFRALAAGETGELLVDLPAPDPADTYPCQASVTTSAGVRAERRRSLVFAGARQAAIQVDGKLDDWGNDLPLRIGLLSGERGDPQDGPPTSDADLSARAGVRWDAGNLYLAVEVRDDVHRNGSRDGALWDGDSIQFGFTADPDHEGAAASEWGAALTAQGPQGWCWRNVTGQPTGPVDLPLAVVRGDGVTVYELAIPWSRLSGIKPVAGTWFGLGLVVNEQDTAERGWYGWHAGIAGDKDPSQFGQVTLQ
ncbi:MAG: hypothetical protein HYU66_25340 [Armatimonadetes bacterium]|nr:hypothetical protein [Armatimonadota bacterium]